MTHTIHDYSSLQVQVRLWAARNDSDFVQALPEFIHMAEQRIAFGAAEPRQSDPVRVRDMQTSVSIDIVNGIGVLPDDYLEQSSMTWDSDLAKTINYRNPEEFHALFSSGDLPVVFTVEDQQLLLKPLVTGTADFVYYARYATLENDSDTNFLLQNTPSIYLKGSLIEAFGFTRNRDAQNDAYVDYVSAANGLSMQTRKALLPARLFPSIPGADDISQIRRGF